MPTYDYKCENCNTITEFVHSIKLEHVDKPCPNCGKRKLIKLITKDTGANIIFKGEGFYRSVDYINKKAKEEGMTHGDEKKIKRESL